jgi:hypothetical protein
MYSSVTIGLIRSIHIVFEEVREAGAGSPLSFTVTLLSPTVVPQNGQRIVFSHGTCVWGPVATRACNPLCTLLQQPQNQPVSRAL